jgi:signal transduction histidine kinase
MADSSEFERYFKVIRDIQRAVHTQTRVREVLDIVVTKSTEILNAKGALIRILNNDTNQFEVRAACGLGNRYLHKGPVTTEKLIADPSNLHTVIVITDIWNAPRVEYPQQVWDEGIRMLLDVPLAIEDQLVGLIRIYLENKREFADSELDFIVTVAEECAGIIERVRLLERQQANFTHLATHVDKMSSLGRMAAGVAHEINNPLAGILLYSSNMRKKVPPDGPLAQGLQIIINETQRCKTIIQGLLDFSRDTEPNKAAADINDIMVSALGIADNEFKLKHVHIDKQLSKTMIQTLLDKNQILQVFLNILLNALQAVEENGRITVRSKLDDKHKQVVVEVEDNGCGISPNDIPKIFDPFFSTKSNGTGLGLAVSYGIIKNHEGNIQAYSEVGKGTRFVVEVPVLTKSSPGEESYETHSHSCH